MDTPEAIELVVRDAVEELEAGQIESVIDDEAVRKLSRYLSETDHTVGDVPSHGCLYFAYDLLKYTKEW